MARGMSTTLFPVRATIYFLSECAITIYFLSEWCRCVADMKNPRMGSTLAYIPFGDLIEAAQMRHYHKKYHKK